MKSIQLLLFLCLIAVGLAAQPRFTDARTERAIDSIITRMTLEEKVGQMTLYTSDWDQTGPTLRPGYQQDIRRGQVGAIFNAHTADYNRELQRMAVEETRLGIPLLFGYDVIHGYRTIFPIPLGETASWNVQAMEESARIAAAEASAAGLHWTFAPMVDISRDPRWGRIMEGAGEDVYLSVEAAKARVRGFQGDNLSAPNTVLACAKHFAAYGAAQAGRDYHTVDISERVLRSVYLPPFEAALESGAATFMTSFNELDGVPASASTHLLTDILRDEWGFNGFVVTDYTSINEMVDHGTAADLADAGLQAVKAGVDMDMQGGVFQAHLSGMVREGLVSETLINEAVRRILRLKFALGLFEDPYRYSDKERQEQVVFAEAHRQSARAIARESIVLLKNDAQTLPFSPSQIKRLAVIGPLADSQEDLLGAWHADGRAEDCIALLEGIKMKLGRTVQVGYAEGCKVEGADRSGFKAAIKLARKSDAIVVAIGEKWWMSGEAASRADISIPGVQEELVSALVKTGKPLVVVLMNGRPLAFPELADEAPAILETWYLGTEAGPAIADVLFGDYNPSGKLPVTFPRQVGQVPLFYAAKNTGRPMDPNDKYTSKYLDVDNTPLYPFGFGLSYTTFSYSDLSISSAQMALQDTLTISVTLSNTGAYAGKEVAQLYIRDKVASVTPPVRALKGFQTVELAPGESKTIQFRLTSEDLALYNRAMEYGPEPGDFEVFTGGSSLATLRQTFTLIPN